MTAQIKDTADVVIVGSGAAGLMAALTLAPRRVLVLSEKAPGGVCASQWSQGGIAAAVGAEDSTESHVADTLKAAAGTADAAVVRALVEAAPKYIEILARYGVQFEKDETGAYKLSREA
ncbi:MAG: FAD-dependent oxidoreductase [Micavibrio sp.]|nr:FAD-dependent oxidoreductase [Micavibrio sp.]